MRDYGVSRSEAATECEVLQVSKLQSTNGLERWIRLGERHAGSKTLWICRCAWTTLPRRPQLHRANISKHCLMKAEKELRLGRRMSEVTRSRVVRRRSLDGPAPHVKFAARSEMRPNGELPSDHHADS